MNPAAPSGNKPAIVHMKTAWKLRHNPFPQSGIAVLGGEEARENGLLFAPQVQQEHVAEAVEKFVLGAAYSGLKFGYLWSLGTGGSGDARGYGKSSLLQYLVEKTNSDFGRQFLLDSGLDEDDADEAPIAAMMASFDMANAKSLAAVFYEATRHACRFHTPNHPTLAARLYDRLCRRLGTDNETALVEAVLDTADEIRGRTLGPPNEEFVRLLCRGDERALGRWIEQVKEGARGRVSSAQYLATFLLFAKAAGIPHVLLGCDQLEDFAATSTAKQKRTVETERFRDFVLELQPMADMLSVVVTLHPRAEAAISEMWHLADLPSLRYDLPENERHIVVLKEIHTAERAEALLAPYVDNARKEPAADGGRLWPLSPEALQAILDRSQGKPREILRKAHALIEHGAAQNWAVIDGRAASDFLDSLTLPEDDEEEVVMPVRRQVADAWAAE
jgi:hypothetical protein